MTAKALLHLATEKYPLHNIELYGAGSVRRGADIPPMWNIPLVIYKSTLVHKVLIVMLPDQLGLFSNAVLRGRATAGGLESLYPGAKTKLSELIPFSELQIARALKFTGMAAGVPTQGSVIGIRHSSGKEFTVNSLSGTLALRLRRAIPN